MPAPSNLQASVISANRIDLSWTLNPPPTMGYTEIWRKVAGSSYQKIGQISVSAVSYQSTGLTTGTRYYYKVRQFNLETSQFTAYSNEVEAVTVLTGPYGLALSLYGGEEYRTVLLEWSLPLGDDYTSIQVFRRKSGQEYGTSPLATIGGTADWYQDSTCDPGTTYWYRIRAYRGSPNYVYSDFTTEKSKATEAIAAPSSLTCPGDFGLSWTNGEYYDGMVLEAQSSLKYNDWSDHIRQIELYPTSLNWLSNTQLGGYYRFRIRGYIFYNDKRYYSAYSNEETQSRALPTANYISSSQTGFNKVTLTWKLDELGAYRYESDILNIYRAVEGGSEAYYGGWSGIGAFDHLTFRDENVETGKKYTYRIRLRRGWTNYVYSDYSVATEQIVGFPSPAPLSATCLTPTSVKLDWKDNSENELGFKIYRYGVLIHTTGPNVTTWTDTTVYASTWYAYYVKAYNAQAESAPSNTVDIFTAYTPAAPSDLVAISVSASQINLSWQDNDPYETDFRIEESVDGIEYNEIDQVEANVTEYQRTGLSSDTLYYYRVRAHNSAGYSAYSNVDTARTLANVGQPTDLEATAFSGTVVELTWTDNSSEEDGHKIERKPSGGSFSQIGTTAKNVDYYRDSSGLSAGQTYIYRVRAYQGEQNSDYSAEVEVTTLSAPAAPAGLAISEHTDTTQRLTWSAAAGAVGYKIEQSEDGSDYDEIMVVEAGVLYFTAQGLTPDKRYWYRVRAYNAAGDSNYSTAADGYTDAEYEPGDFEQLVRQPIFTPVLLAEISPKLTVTGWALANGQTYTYQHVTYERGIDYDRLWENGTELAKLTSVAGVEAAAGSWYFDFHNRTLYVHTLDGADPINVFLEGSFWLYLTNYQDGTITFNGHNYLPFLKADYIPDFSHEIRPVYEGDFAVSAGSLSVMNRESPAEGYYWDTKWARYTWENRPAILRLGSADMTYAAFRPIFAGLIDKITCRDEGMTLNLIDAREGIHRTLPVNKLWRTDYPLMDEALEGTPIPILFGSVVDGFLFCVDADRKKYKFHDGRVKAVTAVKQNGTSLTADTDYFVDLKNGIVTFASTLTILDSDILTVDFSGVPNDADELTSNGADVFMYWARNYWGLSVEEINLDTTYATKAAAADVALSIYLYREQSTSEHLLRLERSLRAHSFQDEQGRIGLKTVTAAAPSSARYVRDVHISNFSMSRDRKALYKTVNVYYAENPKTQDWGLRIKANQQIGWKYRNALVLDVYTFLTSASDANDLAMAIVGDLNKVPVSFEVPALLYGVQVGDLFYLSRERYFNTDGVASQKLMMVRAINTMVAAGRTRIVAEEVA